MKKIVFALILSLCVQADNLRLEHLYILVDSMKLNKEQDQDRLSGFTLAKHIYVLVGGHEVEVNTEDGEIFKAMTLLEQNKLTFKKDNIRFSTPLETDNPVFSLEKVEVGKAEIELSKTDIQLKGESLNTFFNNTRFLVSNINLNCKTDGSLSTDVERICLKNITITPYDTSKKSRIELEDMSQEGRYGLKTDASSLEIVDDSLEIFADDITGNYGDAVWSLKNGSMNCYKNPDMVDINVEELIYGCLQSSKISGESINFNQSALDFRINRANVLFNDEALTIKADKAIFKLRSDEPPTHMRGLDSGCYKNMNTSDGVSRTNALIGCLKKSYIKIDEIVSDSKKFALTKDQKGTNIKEFSTEVIDNKFNVFAKIKMLFHLRVRINGTVNYDTKPNQLRIDVKRATVSGLSARALMLYFLEKFVDARRIKVSGSIITVQL